MVQPIPIRSKGSKGNALSRPAELTEIAVTDPVLSINHNLTLTNLRRRLHIKDRIPDGALMEVARMIDEGIPRRRAILYLHGLDGEPLKVAAISRLLDQRYQTVYNTIVHADEREQELTAREEQVVLCSVCGRPLHDPKSAEQHIGPACSKHLQPGKENDSS